jgi:hypothetical protein
MDRMKVSGALDIGSIPIEATCEKRNKLEINFLRFYFFKTFGGVVQRIE